MIRLIHAPCRFLTPLAALLLLVAAGCDSSPTGQSFSGVDPALAAEASDAAAAAREIEEADVVKVVADRVYVLNRFKGLVIIDASNVDAPRVMGQLDLSGRGVEMYVVGNQVFALLSTDYYYPYIEGGPLPTALSIAPGGPGGPAPDFDGSQLAIIDVTDAAAPRLLGKINLAGYATASRRVGNVIYVIGRTLVPYAYDATRDESQVDEGFVASVNVADPANITPVARETFAGEALELHASQALLLVAGRFYDAGTAQTMTRVQAVDISDPAGAIAVRGHVNVPGFIRNRFYMDDFEDVLRIATESNGFGFQTVRLFTFDLANLDAIAPLGQVEVIREESLEAVRFDGPRGYLVTFLRVDPLFVMDLRNPAAPVVAGQLEVPGFSTHLEPRGDRLFAVGVDDTDGRRPAVSYYNVSDPAAPTELGRVVLGPPGSFTESEAVYDEKAFKVVDELGLIAVPFQHSAPEGTSGGGSGGGAAAPVYVPPCVNAVQLVDFSDAALTQRGWFEHDGWVERVGVLGGRVFSLSQAGFQTVDITDRDEPAVRGVAALLSDEEKSQWGVDYCGYYFDGPVDPGFGVVPFWWLWGSLCGMVGVLPAAGMVLGVVWMGLRGRRRHRVE